VKKYSDRRDAEFEMYKRNSWGEEE
jgi:hypothetical protein